MATKMMVDQTTIGNEVFRLLKKSFVDKKTGNELDYLVVERGTVDGDTFELRKRYTVPLKAVSWLSEALKKV